MTTEQGLIEGRYGKCLLEEKGQISVHSPWNTLKNRFQIVMASQLIPLCELEDMDFFFLNLDEAYSQP